MSVHFTATVLSIFRLSTAKWRNGKGGGGTNDSKGASSFSSFLVSRTSRDKLIVTYQCRYDALFAIGNGIVCDLRHVLIDCLSLKLNETLTHLKRETTIFSQGEIRCADIY
ncbi:hypothetical protein K0M31_008618 [Melipona bicolor]|uniref:Uncharacterized protein n=1 Tax=Melipona bicolor TaxID=60889 RepID=A0AA40FQ75_9HYME|nr:hypothetical protein K0M31_008618 [Melipona bicolor]